MGRSEGKRRRIHLEEKPHTMVHDESNWLVSYADMMTLLFGFFVLMYSLTRFDGNKFDLVRKEIAKYFGGNIKEISAVLMAEQKIVNILKGSGDMNGVEIMKGPEENTLLLKFDGEVLFESGAVEVKEQAKPQLRKVVSALRSVQGVEKINVEGHTDNDPIASGLVKSNWELSSLRAGSVVRYFEESGIEAKFLSAVGYGSAKPLAPNEDKEGLDIPANKALNRRVVVAVKLMDPEAFYRLQQKQFSKQLSKEEIEQQQKQASLQEKMKLAQNRLEEAQRKFREQQDQKKREAALLKLEKQIENLESKAKQFEEKTSTNQAPTQPQ
ncbi:OmpA/MotB family protein [Bdellovibrio reynosensis]|uniref:OmpA family protein n=1 Tax=Bdellovibrio reynosensis TaxID=2835041 RepID=A0ABY4C9M0_9BACT|nr:OmpA family protein [Bdellovibrio reynosensis]UOF00178.1 OmpA family protein [Bdellovibrio reynosensis]